MPCALAMLAQSVICSHGIFRRGEEGVNFSVRYKMPETRIIGSYNRLFENHAPQHVYIWDSVQQNRSCGVIILSL